MIALLLAAAAFSAQCERIADTTVTLAEATRIEFVDADVDLDVRAHATPGRRIAVSGALPGGSCLEFERSGDMIRMLVRRTAGFTASRAQLAITLPAEVHIKLGITTGSVNIRGISGAVSVTTVYAPIIAHDLQGDIVIRAVEADVHADSVRGKVYLRSTARDVYARDIGGDLTIESVGGTMRVSGDMPRNIVSSTWGGVILIDGLPPVGGKFQLTTHSGDVRIMLPEGGRADFEVTTWEAQVRSAVELSEAGKKGEVRRGSVGVGGGRVEISTVQGRVVIGAGT